LTGRLHVHQINLQRFFGGGELYTRFFSRALVAAGCRVTLYVSANTAIWSGLAREGLELVSLRDEAELLARLPPERAIVITQGPLSSDSLQAISRRHFLTGFAHMPLAGREAGNFRLYELVLSVSGYVRSTLETAGLTAIYAEPLYGTVDFERDDRADTERQIVAASPNIWDRRKIRDRVFSWFQPMLEAATAETIFARRPGLALGIVSLLAPIKQFPQLFTCIAPAIARSNGVNLEIFGHGGYAHVRDLRRSLAPIRERVRFWGFQHRVELVYPQLDYVMSGLPEKEAMGLNLLEAQFCGTPVLAVNAPPFTETVLEGRTGFLYRDPREDGGADFSRVLSLACRPENRPDPRGAADFLARFSFAALVARVTRLLDHIEPRAGLARAR